jgi:hypothetical protein
MSRNVSSPEEEVRETAGRQREPEGDDPVEEGRGERIGGGPSESATSLQSVS